MRKSLILAGAAALMLAATRAVDATEPAFPQLREANMAQAKRRKNKTANKINVFMGYASDRKGKEQKKRDASRRQKNGWR